MADKNMNVFELNKKLKTARQKVFLFIQLKKQTKLFFRIYNI